MSHATILCIANDCESVMNGLTGELWDYVNYENEGRVSIDGKSIDEIITIEQLKDIWNKNPQAVWNGIRAVIEYGDYRHFNSMKELEETLNAYDDNTFIKLYDVHQ